MSELNARPASPPPAAWSARERMSIPRQTRRHVFAGKGELFGPRIGIMRKRITYIPAVVHAGAVS